MGDDVTSIRVKVDTWERLRDRKGPGNSFDDVITEVLDDLEQLQDEFEQQSADAPA